MREERVPKVTDWKRFRDNIDYIQRRKDRIAKRKAAEKKNDSR